MDNYCRGFALHKHRPLTLHATIEIPPVGEDESEAVAIRGLLYLSNLFRTIDDKFSRVWNTARSECSPTWLADLQRQLTEALPPELNCTEAQEADIRITQQWLRIVVWQMSTASGCLSSSSPDAFMSFTYPIDVSKEVVDITRQLSQRALEVHGIGLVRSNIRQKSRSSDSLVDREAIRCGLHPYRCHVLRAHRYRNL